LQPISFFIVMKITQLDVSMGLQLPYTIRLEFRVISSLSTLKEEDSAEVMVWPI
jgi:hypothetical protein